MNYLDLEIIANLILLKLFVKLHFLLNSMLINQHLHMNLKVDNTTAADTAQVEDLIQSLEEILHE